MAPPVSACGGGIDSRPGSIAASESDGLFPVYHGFPSSDSGTSASRSHGYAQRMRHGLASNRPRPEMKTFLDLESLSARSLASSCLSSDFSTPRTSKPRPDDFDANLFLFSGRTSTATITTTTETAEATNLMAATSTDTTIRTAGADATTLHHSALRELRDLELMQDTDLGLSDRGRQRIRANNHHLRVFDHLSIDERPSSSRSHLRYLHRSKSPVPHASKYLRVSSDGSSPSINNLPSMTMTRDEFDALPPTIQRKVSLFLSFRSQESTCTHRRSRPRRTTEPSGFNTCAWPRRNCILQRSEFNICCKETDQHPACWNVRHSVAHRCSHKGILVVAQLLGHWQWYFQITFLLRLNMWTSVHEGHVD